MHPALKAILFKGGVSLIALMAGQADGLWYNFAKTDRLFQEPNGPTPADDPNEVIGLAISQRLWLGQTLAQVVAGGAELLTNGSFDSGSTGWTAENGVGVSVSGGEVTLTRAASATERLTQTISAVSGKTYAIQVTSRNGSWWPVVLADLTGLRNESVPVEDTKTYYAVATGGTLKISLGVSGAAAGTAIFSNVSVKEIPGKVATQSSASLKPKFQTAGATGDASDDNLLTAYLAQNGANFIVAHLDVPATLAATQVICGASGSAANRCFLAFNTSGQLCGGVGSDSTSTILGTTDWRGQTVVVALSFDGATVKLYAGTAEEYSAAQNGTPTTTIPFRIFALNNNGTAGSFSAAAAKSILVGRQALTLAQFKSIRSQLLAGA